MDIAEPVLQLWALTGGPQGEPTRIGEQGGRYKVRLLCRDRADDDPLRLHPPETWLLQSWPAT